jgi:hypothetical protein
MRHPHQRGASITQVTNPTAVRAGPCGTARARDHPFRHLDRICDHATANHGRDGSTREAYFHRPNLASRHVRSNLVVCYRYASPPSPGTAELSRRACAAEVVRAGRVYIRCSAGAVTWLARPTGISAAHRPCTASVAAREGQRGNRQHRYDRCGNCCSSEDRTHSCRLPSSRASISSKHQSLRLRSIRRRPHSSRPRGDIASLRLPAVKDCSNPGDLQPRGPLPRNDTRSSPEGQEGSRMGGPELGSASFRGADGDAAELSASIQRHCRRKTSNHRTTSAADRIALPSIMRSRTNPDPYASGAWLAAPSRNPARP